MRKLIFTIGIALGTVISSQAADPSPAGPHWDMQYVYRQADSTLSINDIAFPTAARGIVCGFTTDRHGNRKPVMLLTSDGGKHWTEAVVKEIGLSLFLLDDSIGWMVTEKGVWFTEESGRSWMRLKAPSGLLSVHFLDRTHGFGAGLEKRVFETFDGGETWALLSIVKDLQVNPTFMTFGEIAFSGRNGLISGWNIPPQRGGPAWMEQDKTPRRQQPNYTVLLQTKDAGKTWTRSESSVFGQVTRISMAAQGTALGLMEFKDQFEYPSEVYRINLHSGVSTSAFRSKDRAITDVRLFDGSNAALLAGFETSGGIYHSPIPGKLKILTSQDSEDWQEMPVDYRAVAHRAMIAGPDPEHVWVATDTGMILNLVQ